MSEQRFKVLEGNPLTVWDEKTSSAIHLGSQRDALDLAELLNSLHNKVITLENQ